MQALTSATTTRMGHAISQLPLRLPGVKAPAQALECCKRACVGVRVWVSGVAVQQGRTTACARPRRTRGVGTTTCRLRNGLQPMLALTRTTPSIGTSSAASTASTATSRRGSAAHIAAACGAPPLHARSPPQKATSVASRAATSKSPVITQLPNGPLQRKEGCKPSAARAQPRSAGARCRCPHPPACPPTSPSIHPPTSAE